MKKVEFERAIGSRRVVGVDCSEIYGKAGTAPVVRTTRSLFCQVVESLTQELPSSITGGVPSTSRSRWVS